ncbi:MAG: S41 family peptidase [Flavisolibacter sp.]
MKKKLFVSLTALAGLFILLLFTNLVRIPFYVSKAETKATLLAAADSLERFYILPEVGKKMANALREGLSNEKFTTHDPEELGKQVNSLLQNICNDKHFQFFFMSKLANDLRQPGRKRFNSFFHRLDSLNDFFIMPVKKIKGSIGYLRLDQLIDPKLSGERLEKSFDSLKGSKAIIIDLRNNGGGEPEMVQRVISHFYKADTLVHINDIYSRRTNSISEYWTLPEMKGVRMPEVPLFILTSKNTASAAEELAYDLQKLHRATVIGEITSGGAHPGDLTPVGERFVMFLSDRNAINPYSKSNWEGKGVIPDIKTDADKALETAVQLAN